MSPRNAASHHLQALYEQYHPGGFEILAFPCDQFGHQEPGSDAEIANFCDEAYGVTFPLFAKIEVNGKNAHPLYVWLKQQKGGLLGQRIKWNFTKFLVDRAGIVRARFAPTTKPESLTRFSTPSLPQPANVSALSRSRTSILAPHKRIEVAAATTAIHKYAPGHKTRCHPCAPPHLPSACKL
jgi:glutathione peroxidase-family protein